MSIIYKKRKGTKQSIIYANDLIVSNGIIYSVFEVLIEDGLSKKPELAVHRIYEGKVLTNTSKYIGSNWEHLSEQQKQSIKDKQNKKINERITNILDSY